jgi:hypothetical protein
MSADGKLSGDEIRFYTETLDQVIRTIQLLIAAAPTPIQNSAHSITQTRFSVIAKRVTRPIQ